MENLQAGDVSIVAPARRIVQGKLPLGTNSAREKFLWQPDKITNPSAFCSMLREVMQKAWA